ncbi:ATPase, partial [Candidatus Bipolaricaulota bacterium]|nr:ATPase [Candidatus Bipolaricaulota bacterium]
PDDIKALAVPALAHRLILSPDLWAKRITAQDIVTGVVANVPVPKVP